MDDDEEMFGFSTPVQKKEEDMDVGMDLSSPGTGTADSDSALCILGDGEPKAKGSCFCRHHKKISDNLYNQEKARTGAKGEDWEQFLQFKKGKSSEYLNLVMCAAGSKIGQGRGNSTKSFNVAVHLHKQSSTTRVRAGGKKAWKTYVGFSNHCKGEFGWTPGRCLQEWTHLLSHASPEEKKTTHDRVSNEPVEWALVPLEEYAYFENEIAQTGEIVLEGGRKKNPESANVDKMIAEPRASHSGLNSSIFSPLKAGTVETTSAFASVPSSSASVSSLVTPKHRGENGENPQPKKRAKTWDQDQEVSNFIKRATQKIGALQEAVTAIKEKADTLEKSISQEEQTALARPMSIQSARVPLLDAWAHVLNITSHKTPELPEEPAASEEDKQLFQKGLQAYNFVVELARGHGQKPDEFTAKAATM